MTKTICGSLVALALVAVAPAASADAFDEAMAIVSDPVQLAKRADEAADKFKDATDLPAPKNVHAWYNLGLLAYSKGQFDEAKKDWQKALSLDAKYLPAQAKLAELELERGNKAAGKSKLEAIVKDNRYQAEARNALAALAIENKKWDEAKQHARNVLLGDPTNVSAYLNLAVAFYREGLVDQAGLIAQNALEKNPKAGSLYNIVGLVYLSKDDTRRATENFIKALKADPSQLDARLNLATLELAYGDFPTALKRLEQVIAMRKKRGLPDDAMLELTRAVALRGLKKYDEAEKGYRKALKLDPKLSEAQYNLCVLRQQYSSNGAELAKWKVAKVECDKYMAEIDRKHPKYREIKKRLKAIDSTIEALQPDPAATGQANP